MALAVSDKIPYGNVTAVEIIEDEALNQVFFTADAHGGLERLWFCFRITVKNSSAPKTELVFKHFESILGGGTDDRRAGRIAPVICYPDKSWERMDFGKMNPSEDGRMALSWIIDTPEDYVDVAICYPYGMEHVKSLVDFSNGFWKLDEIGVSQLGNPLVRLSNSYGNENSDRPGVYIVARQHASEVGGSWVLDGVLRKMAEFGDNAPMIWCVPLANIDGVLNGDYGKNPFPHDLNRAWDPGRPMRHETKVFMQDMQRWTRRCKPVAFYDFHSPAIADHGIFCFTGSQEKDDPVISQWLASFKNVLDAYACDDFVRVATYKEHSVWGEFQTSKEFAYNDLKIPGITFECTYMEANGTVMTTDHYHEAGNRIADEMMKQIH